MLINEKTKIAALLKHHPDALETIVKLSPDFKKLRNPVLRALMAGRTTIAMASKIGGCGPEDFFTALAPLGFQVERSGRTVEQVPENKPRPAYLRKLSEDRLIRFDVRELLEAGTDPLRPIQQKVKALKPGEALVIINNFEPVPLIKLLEKQGFLSYVNFIDPEQIETYFYRMDDRTEVDLGSEETGASTGDWEPLLEQYKDKLIEIDVRHLNMPMPMMRILESLDDLPEGKALYVYHKKVPVFLLNELKDREFEYRIKEVKEGEVYLLIFKQK